MRGESLTSKLPEPCSRGLSTEDYKTIFQIASEGIFISSREGDYLDVNPAGCQMLGYTREEILNMNIIDLLPPEELRREPVHYAEMYSGKTVVTERRLRRKDGSLITVEISGKMLSDGRLLGIVRDISERRKMEIELTRYQERLEELVEERTRELKSTNEALRREIRERKRAEENLRKSRAQLRQLTARLDSVLEEERKRIVQEIHDELGQQLAFLKLQVEWLMDHLPRVEPSIRQHLEQMARGVDEVSSRLHQLSQQLRPGLLDKAGFTAALNWYIRDFEKRTGIKCTCNLAPVDHELNAEIAINLFRIAQEGLTNVLRHAKATAVTVQLKQMKRNIVLSLSDNGCGIAPEDLVKRDSLGLVGIRERIRSLNGEFEIQGKPGKGTTLKIMVPLPKKEESK
ncbi:MAG: PAS domain-containing sensor histidine kinase [Calditrichaeota bacterium]|nr:MAG: PAS domain-containing sensor histidine kinase [Calditrichota bacterium]